MLDCDSLFAAFDHDGDGVMDVDEFVRWIETGEELLADWEEESESQDMKRFESDWQTAHPDVDSRRRERYSSSLKHGMQRRR